MLDPRGVRFAATLTTIVLVLVLVTGSAWLALDGFRAVMFVSGNAVRHFFGQRPAAAPWPVRTRAWATGNGTSEALRDAGVAPFLIDSPAADAAQFDSETLWQQVGGQLKPGDKVLIVRAAALATVSGCSAAPRPSPTWRRCCRSRTGGTRGPWPRIRASRKRHGAPASVLFASHVPPWRPWPRP